MLFLRAGVDAGPYVFMRNKQRLLLLLLIAALIPYLITCFYALPFADDFCFGWTASEHISFFQKFLKQYLHWNGRYTSDILVNFHPLITGSILQYQFVSFVSILAVPFVFFVFIRQWVNNSFAAIIAALFISLFYLCYLPNLTEGVYWYIGLVNYHWGSLCLILQLTALAVLLKSTNIYMYILSLLLLVIAIGYNEIAAAIIPAYYLAMIIYAKTTAEVGAETRKILWVHFAVAVIASAFVILSPGNFTRANEFQERLNLLHSMIFAGMQTIRFIGQWSMTLPFIALSLLVMVNAGKVKNQAIKKVHAGIWFALLLFTVYMAAFIPYLATGILGQHRTMNYVFPFFIILWTCTLISLSTHYYGIAEERTPETRGNRALILTLVALVVMSVTGNAKKILMDFESGAFPAYKTEFMARQAVILQQPTLSISSIKNIPSAFQVVDVKSDTSFWVDKCMKRFYTKTDIVLH